MDFNWSDHYSIGIPEIDIQNHRILIMIKSISSAQNCYEEEYLIHKLYLYMSFHFHFMEKLMTLYGYPDIDRHKDSHSFYLYQISKYILPIDKEKWNMECFLHFLTSWFTEHTKEECIKWGKYINSKKKEGVKHGRRTHNQPVSHIQCG